MRHILFAAALLSSILLNSTAALAQSQDSRTTAGDSPAKIHTYRDRVIDVQNVEIQVPADVVTTNDGHEPIAATIEYGGIREPALAPVQSTRPPLTPFPRAAPLEHSYRNTRSWDVAPIDPDAHITTYPVR